MHAISSYLGNRPTHTNKHTHTHTNNPQTGPITIHCAAKLSAQCKNKFPLSKVRKTERAAAVTVQ